MGKLGGVWGFDKRYGLTSKQVILYLYLCTNERIDVLGAYSLGLNSLLDEAVLGYTNKDDVLHDLKALERVERIIYDEKQSIVAINSQFDIKSYPDYTTALKTLDTLPPSSALDSTKRELKKAEKKFKDGSVSRDVDKVFSIWQEWIGEMKEKHDVALADARKTSTRIPKVKTLLAKIRKELCKDNEDEFGIIWKALRNASTNEFNLGKNDRGWKINLDYLLRFDRLVFLYEMSHIRVVSHNNLKKRVLEE